MIATHNTNKKTIMRGEVHSVNGEQVRTLVRYGLYDQESKFFDFPVKLWPDDSPPEVLQSVRIEWEADQDEPAILPDPSAGTSRNQFIQNIATENSRRLLGIEPGDKIVVFIGPNVANNQIQQSVDPSYWLINVGWGEVIAMSRLPFLAISMGIDPSNFEVSTSEVRSSTFDPEKFSKHHIFFLGSIMSNSILNSRYWCHSDPEWKKLSSRCKFSQKPTAITFDGKEYRSQTDIPQQINDWDQLHILDHFLLARMPNPFSKDKHFKCILSCGAATIGTGYGAVVLSGRESVQTILEKSNGEDFCLVASVDMHGFFNPKSDPVTMIRFNEEELNVPLLVNAISSPTVWDPLSKSTESEIKVNQEITNAIFGTPEGNGGWKEF
jgi:hypothetical protein